MRDFFQQADRIYFDEMPCKELDIIRHIPKVNTDQFKLLAGLSSTVSHEQIFNNLKLITKEGLIKNGAALFFAENPEQFFEKAVIRCIVFDGIDKRYCR